MKPPRLVQVAVYLIAATLVLGLARALSGPFPVVLVSTSALVALVAWQVWRGRNWARWTFVVLTVVGSVPLLASVPAMMAASRMDGVLAVGSTACNVLAAVLLFLPASAAWFMRPPTASG